MMSGADMVAWSRMNGKRIIGQSRMPGNDQSGGSTTYGIELEVDDDGLYDGMSPGAGVGRGGGEFVHFYFLILRSRGILRSRHVIEDIVSTFFCKLR